MKRSSKINRLKCPYCESMFPSDRDLRIHVGKAHREKIDTFISDFLSGRSIEIDFVTFMLQRATMDVTSETCNKCGRCNKVCPISRVDENFTPMKIVEDLRSNNVKELLKSDVIWSCTSCFACKDECLSDTSPYDMIRTLWNLSARIGYHIPKIYNELDERVSSWGIIQRDQLVRARSGEKLARRELSLPDLVGTEEIKAFTESLKNLKLQRLVL